MIKHPAQASLLQIAGLWLDRDNPLRQEAVRNAAPEFCLSSENFELALDWIFSQWTTDNISAALRQPLFPERRTVVQVLAGTTPAMIAQGFFQGALLYRPQCLKLPARQTRFGELLLQAFQQIAPELATLFELNKGAGQLPRFYQLLQEAELALIYGNDETIATLQTYLSADALVLAHGHAESIALIFKESAEPASLKNLAYDFLSYDQRGCLSPRSVLIEEGGELSPGACARVFAEEILPPLAELLSRGGLFPGEAAEILHQRSLYGFRGPVYCGKDWTVCYEETTAWPEQALPRFLPFKPFAHEAQLEDLLQPIQGRLISIGYAGPLRRLKRIVTNSSTRLCALGSMQKQLLFF